MSDSAPRERSDTSAAADVGAAIKRESRELAGEAKGAAYRMACDQRDALAGFVSALADAAKRGADELETSGYPGSAAAVKRTADEVGGLVQRLQRREPGEFWEDFENFTRDHPAVVFGAGFALAFGFTRFMKSASDVEPQARGEAQESPAEAATAPAAGQ